MDKIFHDEVSVRRLIARFPDRRLLRVCYELARLLIGMGVRCEVIAPSLIPKAPGDHVKTDKRDCRRLARLYRAGELTAIHIPTAEEEAVRDLCRARADLMADRGRARQRLSALLLPSRPGVPGWGRVDAHPCPAAGRPTLRSACAVLDIGVIAGRCSPPGTRPWTRSRPTWPGWYDRPPFADCVHRLGGLTLACEVCD
ncbi:MAG: IS110 family transposase [Egibacteraceae bacterium]